MGPHRPIVLPMQAGCNMSSSKPCTWWFKPSHADPELKILPQGVQESLLPTAFSDGQLYFAGGDSPNPPCPRPNVLSCNCNSPQHLAHDTISPMCVIMLPPPNVIMRLFGWRLHVLCWHAFLKSFDSAVVSTRNIFFPIGDRRQGPRGKDGVG